MSIKIRQYRSTRSILKKYCIAAIVLAGVTACNEDESPVVQDKLHVGVVRPVGEAIAPVERFEIGKGGSVIKSSNGIFEINIPPDALSGITTIGIQAVENTAPNGTGTSYRLTPHDVEFHKSVTITFVYDESTISFEDGVGGAFQDDDGIWYWPGNVHRDKSNRKVSIETAHFGDWSLFESIKLLPPKASVEPGGIVNLIAWRVISEDMEEDLLTPLVDVPKVPLGEPELLASERIIKWELVGEGALNPSGNTATYSAPEAVPDNTSVSVNLHVKLKSSTDVLTSHITIGESEVLLNGGPYENFMASALLPANATYVENNNITLVSFNAAVANDDGVYDNVLLVQVMFPENATGEFEWNAENCAVSTSDPVEGTIHAVAGTFIKNPDADPDEEVIINSGRIKVDAYGPVGEIVSGRFDGEFTFIDSRCECITHGTIEGTFVAKRAPDV